MRKIIFRGKRIDNGEWVEGYYVKDIDGTHRIMLDSGHSRGIRIWEKVIPETVGQFTGLKDKNGKKIFEGDVVKYGTDTPQEIVFDKCEFGIEDCYARLKVLNEDKMTIIGNIHDKEKEV